MQSEATTVSDYIKSLEPDKALVIKKLRALIKKNLPKGFVETMRWGMISYEVPLSRYPNTYNKQPLSYVGLASQKNKFSLYLMGCYSDEKTRKTFESEYRKSGKPMDMGKSCIRFKKLDDLPLELIEKTISGTSVDHWIEIYEKARVR